MSTGGSNRRSARGRFAQLVTRDLIRGVERPRPSAGRGARARPGLSPISTRTLFRCGSTGADRFASASKRHGGRMSGSGPLRRSGRRSRTGRALRCGRWSGSRHSPRRGSRWSAASGGAGVVVVSVISVSRRMWAPGSAGVRHQGNLVGRPAHGGQPRARCSRWSRPTPRPSSRPRHGRRMPPARPAPPPPPPPDRLHLGAGRELDQRRAAFAVHGGAADGAQHVAHSCLAMRIEDAGPFEARQVPRPRARGSAARCTGPPCRGGEPRRPVDQTPRRSGPPDRPWRAPARGAAGEQLSRPGRYLRPAAGLVQNVWGRDGLSQPSADLLLLRRSHLGEGESQPLRGGCGRRRSLGIHLFGVVAALGKSPGTGSLGAPRRSP